jgi:hypothetical protein
VANIIPQERNPVMKLLLLLPNLCDRNILRSPSIRVQTVLLRYFRACAISQVPAMEENILERFQTLYPGRRVNEAALFVGNRVVLSQPNSLPVYERQLDQFVSKETAQKQQAIRFGHTSIKPILGLTCSQCRIVEKCR